MPRRKPRVPCPVDGCATPIIDGWLMCRGCWMSLPLAVRKAHSRHWKALREFITPRTWQLRPIKNRDDYFRREALIDRHHRCCDLVIAKAGRIRKARGLAPDNVIEHELKDMGLI